MRPVYRLPTPPPASGVRYARPTPNGVPDRLGGRPRTASRYRRRPVAPIYKLFACESPAKIRGFSARQAWTPGSCPVPVAGFRLILYGLSPPVVSAIPTSTGSPQPHHLPPRRRPACSRVRACRTSYRRPANRTGIGAPPGADFVGADRLFHGTIAGFRLK